MKQDVSYWLAEVQSLQQQLNLMRQERDSAYNEAAQWRDRYNDETQLRQQKTALLQSQIHELEAAQASLSGGNDDDAAMVAPADVLESLADMTNLEELQDYVQEVAQERDRFRRALETERLAHGATRQELSLALGDTIDLLTQRESSSGTSS